MSKLERFGVQLRASAKDGKLYGHASVFDQFADLGSHLEAIGRSAFDRPLADANTDVRALFNHNPDYLLGRQSSGTLQVATDRDGLEFEVDLPDTQWGHDVEVLARRGDITGASFAFVPGESDWSTVKNRRLQTHTSVRSLVDVSPVTFPAYDGAAVAMRSEFKTGPASRQASQLVLARHRVHLGRD